MSTNGQVEVRHNGQVVEPEQGSVVQTFSMERAEVPLTKLQQKCAEEKKTLVDLLLKQEFPEGYSKQGGNTGMQPHPFSFSVVRDLMTANPYHGRSIHAKVAAIVGLGFESEADRLRKAAKRQGLPEPEVTPEQEEPNINRVLNPLCDVSWQSLIRDVAEDFCGPANGYIEVRRLRPDGQSPIVGLHHLPAHSVYVEVENLRYDRHYRILPVGGGTERRFARFGDLDGYLERNRITGAEERDSVSEVIHFPWPSSLSRWYGFPDWLSAIPNIELAQMQTRHEFAFYQNRGVPEFIMAAIGMKVSPADKKEINAAFKDNIGPNNRGKSMFLNFPDVGENAKLELFKLAMESKSNGSEYSQMSESNALQIVSAHGVPPLLAGIQIPGKLGASNEMVQAMEAFQALVVGPAQRIVSEVLDCTLGDPEKNGGLALTRQDLALNKITDALDVKQLDTVARMRQSPQEAEAEGRDISEGLRG